MSENKYTLADFYAMPVRVAKERDERRKLAARAMNYHIPFLDDCLRALLPHDLVLLTAPSGMGKTDLSLAIAVANAQHERKVAYFALEAENNELERRVKFAWLSRECYRRGFTNAHELNFTDWFLGLNDDVISDELDQEANQWMLNHLSGLRTFYRGEHFDSKDLRNAIQTVYEEVDLIIVDHLHYVDAEEDEDENRSLGETMKTIRDITIRIGRPILLVAHLRKRDMRTKHIFPTLDDIHGSSNITKICTQVIAIEQATIIDAPKWWLAPTFMGVLKDRRSGATPLLALTMFDRRTRGYSPDYTLGRLLKGRTVWEQLKLVERPRWARGYKQMELEV